MRQKLQKSRYKYKNMTNVIKKEEHLIGLVKNLRKKRIDTRKEHT